MEGIKNMLLYLNENYVSILVIIGLIIALYRNITDYLSKSEDEKITIAKSQIKERILKMITDAEIDFAEWNKAGSIKRSQVIGEIFERYPILSKLVNQIEIIDWIDNEIDESLKTLREIIKNKDK